MKRVIVVGAGLAGLAAAHALSQAGVQVTVIEKQARVGGRVQTERVGGFEIETGAQFITNFYRNTLRLLSELHLRENVVPIVGAGAIARAGKVHRLQTPLDLISSRLISTGSKWQLTKLLTPLALHWQELDIYAFHKAYRLDTLSVSEYVQGRLNEELLVYIFQPLLSGIFYWSPERTSVAMLYILLKASLGMRPLALRHGLGQLAEALARHQRVLCNSEVTKISGEPQRSGTRYGVEFVNNGREEYLEADGIVCAIPAIHVPNLCPDLNDRQQQFFLSTGYSACVNVVIAVDQRLPSEIYGLFYPGCESKVLCLASVESAKRSEQTPDGQDMLKLFTGDAVGSVGNDDSAVRDRLLAEVARMGPAYLPGPGRLFSRVYRWQPALPEFAVGHFKKLKAFADGQIEEGKRLVFAGDYLGGPFIEGAITSGREAARRLLQRLNADASAEI